MKRLYSMRFFIILLVIAGLISCSDDTELANGISGQNWTEGKTLNITVGKILPVTFNALNQWTATSSEAWCEPTEAGNAGESKLELFVSTGTTITRTATITINVSGYSPVSLSVTQKAGDALVGDVELNRKVDAYLKEKYLWNDEYKTLNLDFNQDYQDFFYNALNSLQTNILDKRLYDNRYSLFSNIQKKKSVTSRSTKYVKKELRYSYGITNITTFTSTDIGFAFMVQGVYPSSPAAEAGIKRGTVITSINGQKLSSNTWMYLYYDLMDPASTKTVELTDFKNQKFSITSRAMYTSPIIKKQVQEIDGHKVGYLVYSEFDAGYDDELFEAFKEFKSQGVTDLILDLRYNYGGHIISANLIASCIVGSATEKKVFNQYRYNDERMKKRNNKLQEEYFFYSNYDNLGTSLVAGGLNLSRVYCLVGSNTASASELVINSLKGIDIEMKLIGEKTLGKNVGMESEDITVGSDTYTVIPITFQCYNAKGFGDYATGFTPDLVIDELNPNNESNIIYLYRDYGTKGEYLYAAAMRMITGKDLLPATRTADAKLKGEVQSMPQIYRPGHGGMIKTRSATDGLR